MTRKKASQPGRMQQQLAQWLAQLALAPSIADVHELIEQVCTQLRRNPEYRLIWNDTASTHSIAESETLVPSQALQEQLASGVAVEYEDQAGQRWTLLPLLHGWLRGWLALPKPRAKDTLLLPIALQAAARLATFGANLRTIAQIQELRAFEDRANEGIEPLLDELYSAVQNTLGAQHMFVALYDAGSGLLSFAANFIDGKRAPTVRQWTVAQGLTGEIIRTNSTLVVDNYRQACAERGITPLFLEQAPEVYAWLGVPLRNRERVLGVLTIYTSHAEVHYSTEYVHTLEMFAAWAASSLERVRLYERTIEQARQLELLNELGRTVTSTLDLETVPSLIMGRVQQIMDVEEGSLLLLDEATHELIFSYSLSPYGSKLIGTRMSTNVGVAGLVVRTGQSLIVNRAREHPAFFDAIDEITGHETLNLLCVPLIGRDGCKGVIEILNKRDGSPFTPRDRALLEAVADQAVIAIENANLYTRADRALARRLRELDERNKQLHEILQVGNLIKAASDLQETLPQVAAAVQSTTRFEQVAIWLLHTEPGLRTRLRLVTHAGYTQLTEAEPIDPEQVLRLLGRLQQRGESTYYLDTSVNGHNPLQLNPRAPTDLPQPRIGAWHPDDMLITPLRAASGEILGVLTADMPSDGMLPTSEQIRTLEIFTNQLVVALENARLYEQLRRNLQGVTALSALGMALNTQTYDSAAIWQLTVGGIVDSSGALGAGIFMPASNEDTASILKIGRSHEPDAQLQELLHQAMQRGRPIQLQATDTAFPPCIQQAEGQALLLLPLEASGKPIGTLYIWYADILPEIEEQDLVVLFANQAAVAVENRALALAVREGRDRLASILASTEEAILLLTDDLIMIEGNAAAQRLLGLTTIDTFLGQSFNSVLEYWSQTAQLNLNDKDELYVALQAVKTGLEAEARGQVQGGGVRPRWYAWTVLPVLSEHAQPPYPSILVLRDVTAAMEIEHMRQDLTYMIVHDLRGPISSILTSLDMLSKQMMGTINEGQDKVLRIAMRSCSRLLDMVNMLLDISKMEAGQMPLEQSEVAMVEIVRTVLQTFDGLMAERKVSANVQIEDDLPKAWIDASTIDRVVQNLVDNAIKYTPTGREISIAVDIAHTSLLQPDHPAGEWLIVRIRDQGPGIPQHFRERVFEKFAQVQKSGVKGTGLGLTYCRLAVEAHGGRIWVGETDDGPGSTFLFTIPINTALVSPPNAVQAKARA